MNFPRLRRVLWLIGFFLAVGTLFRIIFFYAFRGAGGGYTDAEVWESFLLGLRFDLRVALVYALPAALLSFLPPLNPAQRPGALIFWHKFYVAFTGLLLLVYFFDIGHYSYLQGRINVTILAFLENPLISAQMMWESYNLIGLLCLFSAAVLGVSWLLRKYVFISAPPGARGPWKHEIAKGLIVTLLYVLGLHGSLGQYPLRWSDAYFANNGFITAMAMNPVHYFLDTLGNPEKDFDRAKTQSYYDRMAAYLGVIEPNKEELSFRRPVELRPLPEFNSRPNVVYIVMESMAAYKTGAFGNRPEASPEFDAIAKKGILFTNFYTPTEGTARSLFCVLTSLPDINAKSTSSRNPLIIHQNTLINAFKGYEKFYFIGGSAAWGNIRGVYKNNIPGLKLYEDRNLEGPRTDVWGLSDLHLFREAARVLGERDSQEPFFAVIQSASFHRPYTIPEDRGDFKLEELSKEELEKWGWASNLEYNSFRFQDYSLGEFFRRAEKLPFFKNTIFVIHGDHGLPHHGAHHLSEGYKHFNLNRFHVPLVIYSPLLQRAERNPTMATEMDVMPTLAGITGHPFMNTSMGRNLFALPRNQPRYAWSYVYYASPLEFFLYDTEFLIRGTVAEGATALYKYNSAEPLTDVKAQYPEKFAEMAELLLGYYETGKWLIFHNKPDRAH